MAEKKLASDQIERRRDEALRRALNTPPKPHDDMKLGKSKPKRKPTVSASKSS